MIKRSIGLKIKDAREARGWSQVRLAEQANISKSLVAMIESGKANPSVKALDKVGKALSIDPAYFMEDAPGVFFDDFREHFTAKEREFLAQEESRSWITLSKELNEKGLTPEQVKAAIKYLMKISDEFKTENPS